ncbi:outer membrane protein assembly factor BamB family protein [Natronorubrum daqingense]|uniref:Outer membrane protein assembly factor BamB, contains PQQ-like beta-propeller repeat n=1 Tax=Natronorubrum daqingense TaxID=588898 RepID=A0A1N7BWK8_9EURY|nr:PQQ-binding-like beta-propeller repeat protein [Natronorubrum daqingense]APX96627.1 pyrrolo-quinoline quinone [Natronorubrum daqingense]SIR55729.1 Outer membrane protein assembly factor BamB, contains PQQ-like beta-propeller repeat [Natronorubrum daqingense]
MNPTRRTLLASAAVGSAGLAGCTTFQSASPDEPPDSGVDELPDPDDHIFGADGSWSSFGCNASNTRAVADGEAPVDGVSERWRVEVGELSRGTPVVADGRVYHPDHGELQVLDADDGSELWTLEDARRAPICRDDVVYATVDSTIYALEPDTGDALWEHEFDASGTAMVLAHTRTGVVCGVREEVVCLEPDDGSVEWRRDVFGNVLEHGATFGPSGLVVATAAGMVYVFDEVIGEGWWRWQLPTELTCPPTAGRDAIYVACRDGTTYALTIQERDPVWSAETGVVNHGIGYVDDLVLATDGQDLHAVDAETGTHHWDHEIGDWNHTAPAYGRETVFVGGDRLWAFDPTPGDSPEGGPAVRFDREFAGRVGAGPILDDGSIYVVAEVEDDVHALLALE